MLEPENTIQKFREIISQALNILSKFSSSLPEQQVVENLNKFFEFFVGDFCPFYESNKSTFAPNRDMIDIIINLFNKLVENLKKEDFNSAQNDLNAIDRSLKTLNDALAARLLEAKPE